MPTPNTVTFRIVEVEMLHEQLMKLATLLGYYWDDEDNRWVFVGLPNTPVNVNNSEK